MAHEEVKHGETPKRVTIDALAPTKRRVFAAGFIVWLGCTLLGFGIPFWGILESMVLGIPDVESQTDKILPIGITTSAVGVALAMIFACVVARMKLPFRRTYYQPAHTFRRVARVIARRLGLVGAIIYCLSVVHHVPELVKLWREDGFRSVGRPLVWLCGVAIIISCIYVGYYGIVNSLWKWAGVRCPRQSNESPLQFETTK